MSDTNPPAELEELTGRMVSMLRHDEPATRAAPCSPTVEATLELHARSWPGFTPSHRGIHRG